MVSITDQLLEYIKQGKQNEVSELIASGVDLSFRDGRDEHTLLHIAAAYGQVQICSLLLATGFDIDIRNRSNASPLHVSGNALVSAVLLAHGATVWSLDENWWTPLHMSAAYGDISMCKTLLEAGSSLKARTNQGETPLHLAVESNTGEMVLFLIQAGVPLEACDKSGQTALHWAAKRSHPLLCNILLEAGANPLNPDNKGITPYDLFNKSVVDLKVLFEKSRLKKVAEEQLGVNGGNLTDLETDSLGLSL